MLAFYSILPLFSFPCFLLCLFFLVSCCSLAPLVYSPAFFAVFLYYWETHALVCVREKKNRVQKCWIWWARVSPFNVLNVCFDLPCLMFYACMVCPMIWCGFSLILTEIFYYLFFAVKRFFIILTEVWLDEMVKTIVI